MAISVILPGIEVTVEIDGQTAQEYDDPYANEMRDDGEVQILAGSIVETKSIQLEAKDRPYVQKYIEAKSGARFGFKIVKHENFRRQSHHIAYEVEVGGRKTSVCHETRSVNDRRYKWEETSHAIAATNPGGGYTHHFYKFTNLNIIETDERSEEESRKDMEKAKTCGVLRVYFYHMHKSAVDSKHVGRNFDPAVANSLSEKAMKGRALTHGSDYDSLPSTRPPRVGQHNIFKDSQKRPFAVFEFQYRSKEGLMREGVIPRPTPAEEAQQMSEQEARLLAQQLLEDRQRRESEPLPKKEERGIKSENLGMEPRGIKRDASVMSDMSAASSSRYKQRRLGNGKFEVDLTD